MKIKLTEKYKPFSHEAGTSLLLPKSSWKVTAYPAKIELENLISIGSKEVLTILPQIEGPIEAFTVMQDLEKGWIRIFGQGGKGYFSYRLVAALQEITLFLERSSKEGISFNFDGENKILKRKEELIIPTSTSAFHRALPEKMHFGSSKQQDWPLVKRRLSLDEILPIWFELGKHIPKHPLLDVGTSRYLKSSYELADQKNRDLIGRSFLQLFKVGFEGILSPRLIDNEYQGVQEEDEIPKEASPLLLLGEGSRLIRKLLIEKTEEHLEILPCLPKEIHSGRFVDIGCGNGLTVDLEWSKKLIRRMTLRPKEDQALTLSFQKPIESFRLRIGRKGKGKIVPVGTPLELKKDTLYILDRFQK